MKGDWVELALGYGAYINHYLPRSLCIFPFYSVAHSFTSLMANPLSYQKTTIYLLVMTFDSQNMPSY